MDEMQISDYNNVIPWGIDTHLTAGRDEKEPRN